MWDESLLNQGASRLSALSLRLERGVTGLRVTKNSNAAVKALQVI